MHKLLLPITVAVASFRGESPRLTVISRLRVVAHALFSLLVFLTLAAPLLAPRPAAATPNVRIVRVKPDAPDTDCGQSWDDACSLGGALFAAVPGDEIWVAAGVYYPGAFVFKTIGLKSGVAVYGGFAGSETSREQRNFTTDVTILSGDLDQNDTTATGVVTDTANITGTNSYHVVSGHDTDSTAILDGFTITAGNTIDTTSDPCGGCGGGLTMFNGNATLANLIFSGNQALTGGGGIYLNHSSPSMTAIIFSGNRANYGGGMSNENGSSPTLNNVIFSGNQADADGGGMLNYKSSPILTNVTISGNQADDGGGMLNYTSSPVFQNSIVWDNIPYGINNYDSGSKPTFRYSLVEGVLLSDNGNLDGTNPANDPDFVQPVNCGGDSCTDDPATPSPDDESANDDYGDLRLKSGSPAIDAGNNNADLDDIAGGETIASIPTDVAGQPRIVAVNALPATVDMGAYERVTTPNADAGGPYTTDEGSSLALDGAASNDEVDLVAYAASNNEVGIVTYAWDCTDDGTVDKTAATPTGSACTYPDDGSYTLRLTVTDNVSATDSVTAQVNVANVAPTVTPASNQSTFAASAKLFALGSFADPGLEDSWPVTVDWGDNSPLTQFNVNGVGGLPAKSHTYAIPATYNVVVTVHDDDASDDGGFQDVVNPLPPGAPNVTAPAEQTAPAGTDQPFALGSFADSGSSGPWQVSVNWGDSSTPTQFSAASAGQLPAKPHTYAADGAYDVVVTVSDGVLAASASFRITVQPDEGGSGSSNIFLPVVRR